jgi:hypothetical protein
MKIEDYNDKSEFLKPEVDLMVSRGTKVRYWAA